MAQEFLNLTYLSLLAVGEFHTVWQLVVGALLVVPWTESIFGGSTLNYQPQALRLLWHGEGCC